MDQDGEDTESWQVVLHHRPVWEARVESPFDQSTLRGYGETKEDAERQVMLKLFGNAAEHDIELSRYTAGE
jgi:hypothetical protein